MRRIAWSMLGVAYALAAVVCAPAVICWWGAEEAWREHRYQRSRR